MIYMKILSSLKTGLSRALKSRKGVLIVWFIMFILVLVFIYPLRRSLSSAFGQSMITEKLANGFDIEVFADLGSTLKSLLSFFTAGFMFVGLIGFVLNSFLTAGLFGSVRKESGKFSSPGILQCRLKKLLVIPGYIIDNYSYTFFLFRNYNRSSDGNPQHAGRNV